MVVHIKGWTNKTE